MCIITLESSRMSKVKCRLSGLLSKRSRLDYLTKLPINVLLLICDHLPASSIGCLVLTAKAFSILLPDARSGLQLPSECSAAGQTLNYPWQGQPQRYIFLRLLEVDLRPHQFLCRDCFTLHPWTAFSSPARVDELRARRARGRPWTGTGRAKLMSCSRDRRVEDPRFPRTLVGIVDLCPCIKLTPARKQRLEAMLYEKEKQDTRPLAPWHTCFHQYKQVRLEIKIWLYFKDLVGPLMARIEYRRTGPAGTHLSSPRRYCPHQNLDEVLCELSQCHNSHDRHSTCASYQRLKRCSICTTELMEVCWVETPSSVMVTYIACFERCLSDENWIYNAAYIPQMLTTN